MKFKNKKTGEIKEWDFGNWYQRILNPDNKESYECTLSEFIDRTAEFSEEWEDYKELKGYWHIFGTNITKTQKGFDEVYDKRNKEIGNYFETKEEAEKAVEKLKAWTRLKDKGFRLNHWKEAQLRPNMSYVAITGNMNVDEEAKADLDLLFGGEE